MVVGPEIELQAMSQALRTSVVGLEVEPEQRRFVAPVKHYLELCDRPDSPWRPFAVLEHGEVVGFVMHGVDPDDDSAWIGGLVIDRAHQRRGIGRAVVDLLVARATADGRTSALSYEPANTVARTLYERAGFAETGEREGDEVVARRPLTRSERLR
jgi:diamine N-acetyltransferase